MAENIVGPHGAGVGATTERPTDTNSGSGTDSWFRDCINGVSGTGTKIPAVWLNKVSALLRRAIRGMGVPESEVDDDMLLKAIQKADRTIANVGDGVGIYAGLNGTTGNQQLRSLKAGSGIDITTADGDSDTDEVVISVLSGGAGSPVDRIAIYNVAGTFTWVVPAGVTRVRATVDGAGGGGTAHQNTPVQAGSGGTSSFGAHVSATGGQGGYYYPYEPADGGGVGGDKNWTGRGGQGGRGCLVFDPDHGVNELNSGANGGRAVKWIDVTPGDSHTVTVGAAGTGAVSDSPDFFWFGTPYTFHGKNGEPGLVVIEW
ncbi:MAG: hypothetical protein ACOYLQ_09405 [Hyphomicrobiaceae bacterium]